jgi:GMP synthase (glutamine-hydrolysing)
MRILFIEFEAVDMPGRLGEELAAMGADIDVVRTYANDPLPALDDYHGLIPLGGAMNAEDDENHPYLKSVVNLIQEASRRNLPTMGVCLGGQLVARALGARVWRKPSMEIGYFPVDLTPEGQADPLFQGFDRELLAFQWHEDAFDLPLGATLLADSKRDTIQAFRHGYIYGLQFHPEVTPDVVQSWSNLDGAGPEIATEPIAFDTLVRHGWDVEATFSAQTKRLCENWMSIVRKNARIAAK